MPNWCDNQVTITGPNKIIDKIEKIANEEKRAEGLLQFMHPMPAELKDTTADGSQDKKLMDKYGYSDWYGWACDNWGTKWDICEYFGVDRQYLSEQSDGESTISFAFSSAWSPPIGAYEYFLAKNEECSLKAYYTKVDVTSWGVGTMEMMSVFNQAITDPMMSIGSLDWVLNWTRCSTSQRAWRSMKQKRKQKQSKKLENWLWRRRQST